MPGKKQDLEDGLVTRMFSLADVICKSSGRITLNDAQESARLVSMECQYDADYYHSADRIENQDDPVEEIAWAFLDFREPVRQDIPTLQTFQERCTKYNVTEPPALVGDQANIEDGSLPVLEFSSSEISSPTQRRLS